MVLSLTILSSAGARAVMEALGPAFERKSGIATEFYYDSALALGHSIESGKPFDVAVLTPAVISALAPSGRISSDGHATLGSVGIGVAIRRGAARMDISTPERFVDALVGASRITFPAVGASGDHFRQILADLDLDEKLNGKLEPITGLKEIEMVAEGHATLGVQLISEIIAVDGVELLGPLPNSLQKLTELRLVPGQMSPRREAAGRFIGFFMSEDARRVIASKGLIAPE